MHFKLNRRTKLIGGIIIGIMLILSGTVFALGKTGVIDLKSFADELTATTQGLIGTASVGNVTVNVTNAAGTGAAGHIVSVSAALKNSTGQYVYKVRVDTNSSGVANFYSLASGEYKFYLTSASCNYVVGNVGTGTSNFGPIREAVCGVACGASYCTTDQHCNASSACIPNCTATSCSAGQVCDSATKECINTGTYSIEGYVRDSATSAALGGVNISLVGGTASTTSSSSYGQVGYFKLTGIPVLDYVARSAQQFKFSKSEYQDLTKTLEGMGLSVANISAIVNNTNLGGNTFNLTKGTTPPTSNYTNKIAGNIKAGTALLAGANFKIVDEAGATLAGTSVTSTATATTNSNLTGNYWTAEFPRDNFNGLYVQVTKDGYKSYGVDTKVALNSNTMIKNSVYPTDNSQVTQLNDIVLEANAPVVDNTKFDWMGSVKMWTDNHLIGGLEIKVVKTGGASGTKTYTGTTQSAAMTNENNVANVNFIVPDILLESRSSYEFKVTRQHYLGRFSENKSLDELNLQNGLKKKLRVSNITLGYNTEDGDNGKLERIKFVVTGPNDAKIPGASINISSFGCAGFNETIQSNSSGVAYYYSENFAKFASSGYTNCIAMMQVSVAKANYRTQITTYSSEIFVSTYRDHEIPINLSPSGPSSVGISGKVLLDGNEIPISGAKIDIWKNTPIENPLKSTYSDNDGKFIINNLTSGLYILSAFKFDYAKGPLSRVYINYTTNTSVEVILNLYTIPSLQDQVVLKIGAMKMDTTPLPGVAMSIKLDGLHWDTGSTNDDGYMESEMLKTGDKIDIEAKYNSMTQTRSFTIPEGYNSLSQQDKLAFQRNLIFYFNTENLIDSVKFKVVRNSAPVSNAQIVYVIESQNAGFRDALDFPYGLSANTKSDGTATLLSDFSYINEQSQNIQVNDAQSVKKLTNGYRQILVKSASKTYLFSKLLDASSNLVILNLDDVPSNTDKIKGYFASSPNSYTTSDLSRIYLEKKVGSEWRRQNIQRTIKEDSAFFSPTSSGIYRIGLESTNTHSIEGTYDGDSPLSLSLGLCESGYDIHKVSFDSGITMAFTGLTYPIYTKSPKLQTAMRAASHRLASARSKTLDTGNVVVFFSNESDFNGQFTPGTFNCYGEDNVSFMQIFKYTLEYIANLPNQETMELMLTQIMLHEYGHGVYDRLQSTKPWVIAKIDSIYSSLLADDVDYVWRALTDGNVFSTMYGMGGHPSDAVWGDIGTEMFASFFSSFYGQHDRFYGIIRYHCTAEGTNILGYMWQLFAENVGQLYTDDNVFFQPINGRVGNIPYSYSQIKQGLWRKLVLSNSSVLTAARTLYTVYLGRITSSWSSSLTSTRLNLINSYVTARLGTQPTGNINITLKNSNGVAMSDIIVQIGQKYCLTDQYGKCAISKLPIGQNQIFKTTQYKNNKNLNVIVPTTKSFIISSGSTISGLIKVSP